MSNHTFKTIVQCKANVTVLTINRRQLALLYEEEINTFNKNDLKKESRRFIRYSSNKRVDKWNV